MTATARKMRISTLALVVTMGCAPVLAADPLGFYVGAGAGHSQARNDLDFSNFGVPGFSGPYSIDGSDTGWKLMAGIRPLSVLGAEVAYLDFGSASGAAGLLTNPDVGSLSVTTTSHTKAGALFAVGYLPIPLPYLDVFAKAGVAELPPRDRTSDVRQRRPPLYAVLCSALLGERNQHPSCLRCGRTAEVLEPRGACRVRAYQRR